MRSYALEVGLDPEETVREFLERFDAEPPPSAAVQVPLTEEETNFENQQRIARVVLKLVVVSLVLVGIILFLTFRNRRAANASTSVEPSVSAAAQEVTAA